MVPSRKRESPAHDRSRPLFRSLSSRKTLRSRISGVIFFGLSFQMERSKVREASKFEPLKKPRGGRIFCEALLLKRGKQKKKDRPLRKKKPRFQRGECRKGPFGKGFPQGTLDNATERAKRKESRKQNWCRKSRNGQGFSFLRERRLRGNLLNKRGKNRKR